MPLWLEQILGLISIFVTLLRLLFWPPVWSPLENAPCALGKNVHSVAVGWTVLHICYVRFVCGIAQVRFVLTDFMSGWAIHYVKWGVEAFYYYCTVTVRLTYLGTLMFDAYIFILVISSCWVDPYNVMPFFVPCEDFDLQSICLKWVQAPCTPFVWNVFFHPFIFHLHVS